MGNSCISLCYNQHGYNARLCICTLVHADRLFYLKTRLWSLLFGYFYPKLKIVQMCAWVPSCISYNLYYKDTWDFSRYETLAYLFEWLTNEELLISSVPSFHGITGFIPRRRIGPLGCRYIYLKYSRHFFRRSGTRHRSFRWFRCYYIGYGNE